jgi:hypothetical protein
MGATRGDFGKIAHSSHAAVRDRGRTSPTASYYVKLGKLGKLGELSVSIFANFPNLLKSVNKSPQEELGEFAEIRKIAQSYSVIFAKLAFSAQLHFW